jgi:nucleoid-associated protein YgaU
MSKRSISPYERYGELSPETDAYLTEYIFRGSDTLTGTEYIFRGSDTLTGLAHRFYSDWRLWRLIAERNRIADVRQIEAGTLLLIPQRPLESGTFERV